jgi:hypothetical protein
MSCLCETRREAKGSLCVGVRKSLPVDDCRLYPQVFKGFAHIVVGAVFSVGEISAVGKFLKLRELKKSLGNSPATRSQWMTFVARILFTMKDSRSFS